METSIISMYILSPLSPKLISSQTRNSCRLSAEVLHIRFLTALTVENALYSSCSIQFQVILPREDDSARTAKMEPILNTEPNEHHACIISQVTCPQETYRLGSKYIIRLGMASSSVELEVSLT